jgi:hypothetical protein
MRGCTEAIYADLTAAGPGLAAFAPQMPALAASFSSRRRLKRDGEAPAVPGGLTGQDLHG